MQSFWFGRCSFFQRPVDRITFTHCDLSQNECMRYIVHVIKNLILQSKYIILFSTMWCCLIRLLISEGIYFLFFFLLLFEKTFHYLKTQAKIFVHFTWGTRFTKYGQKNGPFRQIYAHFGQGIKAEHHHRIYSLHDAKGYTAVQATKQSGQAVWSCKSKEHHTRQSDTRWNQRHDRDTPAQAENTPF